MGLAAEHRGIEPEEATMRSSTMLAAIAISLALSAPAHAAQSAPASYPERPIRLVIGSAPGSGPDIIARVLSERLYKSWNQRIVVDARPGVAGALSAEIVARAAADGYTWLMMTSQLFIATKVYKDLKFDLDKDFASVALIGTVPYVLVVNPQVPAKIGPGADPALEEISSSATARPARAAASTSAWCTSCTRRARRCCTCLTKASRRPWRTSPGARSTPRSRSFRPRSRWSRAGA